MSTEATVTSNPAGLSPSMVPGDVMQKFEEELANLVHAWKEKLPEIHMQCKKINDLLRQWPEIAVMLTEEQIGSFMAPVIAESKIQFSMAATAKKGGDAAILRAAVKGTGGKSAGPVNLEDIQF